MSELLKVSVSPHIRGTRTTRSIMLDVIIALMPALIASTILYGPRALLITAVSAVACVLCEYGWERIGHKAITVGDLSAVVTGIILAFNVPASMPVWEIIIGDIIAIIVVKMLFGGIGCNFVNPAMAGRVILFFSFTSDMTNYVIPKAADTISSATPLAIAGELDWSNFADLFLGRYGGVLGESCSLALIIGGVYLVARRVIKPIIPLAFIGSEMLFAWIFGEPAPVLTVFAGGVMLGAIFMATDYVTSPLTDKGKLIFGIGCGFITAAIRVFANSAGGVSFAVLLMNIVVPYINDLTMPKPFGGVSAK